MSLTKITTRVIDNSVFQSTLSSEGFPVITTDSYVGGFKNFVQNGNFDVWQAGTSFTFPLSNIRYRLDPVPDRHSQFYVVLPVVNGYVQDNPNPSLQGNYSMKRMVCTAQERQHFDATFYSRFETNVENKTTLNFDDWSSVVCLDMHRIRQPEKLFGKTVTLSFWARASQQTKISVHLGDLVCSPYGLTPSQHNKSFDLDETWKKCVMTVKYKTLDELSQLLHNYWQEPNFGTTGTPVDPTIVDSSFEGIKDYQNTNPYGINRLTYVRIYAAQSKYSFDRHGINSEFWPTQEEVNNSLIGQGNYDIAQIQLEVGDVPTSFEYRPYDVELSMAQRHRYVSNQAVLSAYYSNVPWCSGYYAGSDWNTNFGTNEIHVQDIVGVPNSTYNIAHAYLKEQFLTPSVAVFARNPVDKKCYAGYTRSAMLTSSVGALSGTGLVKVNSISFDRYKINFIGSSEPKDLRSDKTKAIFTLDNGTDLATVDDTFCYVHVYGNP